MSKDIVSCYPENSYTAGSRVMKEFTLAFCGMKVSLADYEGHWSEEATKEFKIIFIGIVYKATWKAKTKKAFFPLLCLPTFLHLRMSQDETKISKFLIYNEFIFRFFTLDMLLQYKLDKKFNLTFEENKSLLSSTTNKICFKMLMKSLVNHFLSTDFSIGDWQTLKLVLFYNHFLKLLSNGCS